MAKIIKSLLAVTRTQTIKDAVIVTAGMGLSTLLAAASIFLIARLLGPTGFGLYTTALAIVVIVIDSIDLAISSSIVNFASQATDADKSFIKYGFYLKLILGLTAGALFAVLSQPVANLIHPELKPYLLLAAAIIPAVFLFRFPKALLQSQRRFLADTSVDIIINLLRLAAVVAIYLVARLTVGNSLLAYTLGAVGGLVLGAKLISWDFLKAKVTPKVKRRFFHFQKWLTAGFILAAIHGRVDTAILLRLTDATTTGIYQAAYRFFMPAIQFAAALSLIFAPRFASFPDSATSQKYLFKAAKLSLILAALVLLIIPLSEFLVQLIFGSGYQAAVLPTKILSLGFAFFVAGAPYVSHLIYSTGRGKVFFGLSLIQLALLVGLDLVLIPQYQAVGAALAASLTLIALNTLTAVLALTYRPKPT